MLNGKANMKGTINGILIVVSVFSLTSCSKLAEGLAETPQVVPSPPQPDLQDEAVRAFLGIRASRADLKAPAAPVFYATTFAKFQKGHFVGFGPLGNH